MGSPEKAAAEIAGVADLFAIYGELGRSRAARLLEGYVSYARRDFRGALASWSELSVLAEEAGDTMLVAHLSINIGDCRLELGEFDLAAACFDDAAVRYESQ